MDSDAGMIDKMISARSIRHLSQFFSGGWGESSRAVVPAGEAIAGSAVGVMGGASCFDVLGCSRLEVRGGEALAGSWGISVVWQG